MRSEADRLKFIELRASGKSYESISKDIGICKSTCSEWGQQLKKEIGALKTDMIEEVQHSYRLNKVARLEDLGTIRRKLKTEIDNIDFSSVPPEKLLDLYLKYNQIIKDEYINIRPIKVNATNLTAIDIFNEISEIQNSVYSGEISIDEAIKESTIIASKLKTFETTIMEDRIIVLENAKKNEANNDDSDDDI